MNLSQAVSEGVHSYLRDQDRFNERVAFLEGAESDVEGWDDHHLHWFLCSSACDDLWMHHHRRFAIARAGRELKSGNAAS